MKFVWFVHAIASCWNNGNAHFLRGLGLALQKLGHEVVYCEPAGGWSETNLVDGHSEAALDAFATRFPTLVRRQYDPARVDLDELTDGADVVVVHEWNAPDLIDALGRRPREHLLLFHDTHHRAVTDPDAVMWGDIANYDGVLAFGEAVAEVYRSRGWNHNVWAFHEAADTSAFFPLIYDGPKRDLVWIGNWGDEERSKELYEFLIGPADALDLSTSIFGVRYPKTVVDELRDKGISYNGWLANHMVPDVFSRHSFTVHVPRGPYARQLPGIPTIRVFEALACGIPLISAPWDDVEELFPAGCYLKARDGSEMKRHMWDVLHDAGLRAELSERGVAAIRKWHSCAHRADELLDICRQLAGRQGFAQCA